MNNKQEAIAVIFNIEDYLLSSGWTLDRDYRLATDPISKLRYYIITALDIQLTRDIEFEN